MATLRLIRLADAPHQLETIATWNHAEWGAAQGYAPEDSAVWFREMLRNPSEECVIAERDGSVLGMASLVDHDLDQRPDLVHWLASVYVLPEHRGHGIAGQLVSAVEQEAEARGISRLHLYTNTAESLYTRLGWTSSERFSKKGKEFSLMVKDLSS